MTNPEGSEESKKIAVLQERIQSLEKSLSDRMHELEVYEAVQHAINRQLDVQSVLQIIADQARQLTHCAASAVYIVEQEDAAVGLRAAVDLRAADSMRAAEGKQGAEPLAQGEPMLRLEVISGYLNSQIPLGYRMPLNRTVAGLAVRDRKPYCVQDVFNDQRVFMEAIRRTGMRSFLVVPLFSGDQPIGAISVADKIGGPFTAEDERIMSLLASSVVISLENARLYAQAGELAVINERNRLARELHDAVTQSLFSASLIGDVLPAIWQEDPVEGLRRLEELRRLTRGALAEMRTLLLELRPAALENAPLPELFRHLANAFTGRTQVPVQLQIDGKPEDIEHLRVPAKVGIYRIAQEALQNIAKHAEATNVVATLQVTANGARLEVTDDGLGFDLSARTGGHFGLEIMQERAKTLGGLLEVESQIGKGTSVTFIWMEEQDDGQEEAH